MNEAAIDDAMARWETEIRAIYALAAARRENCFDEAGHLPVSDAIATRIMADTELSVFGYEHIVDTSSVRHILKHHGTAAEYKRGQIPITEAGIVQIAQLLLHFDTIEHTGKTKQGRDVLHYTKVFGDYTLFYTEEIRTKKSRLAAVTLYKRKK